MGKEYYKAVKFCLDERCDSITESEGLYLKFERAVIERLARCSA